MRRSDQIGNQQPMYFTSDVIVERSQRQVAAFFGEPANLAKWDRSVAQVIPTSDGPTAVGFTFDTIAPSGLRMSYRITEHVPEQRTSIALERSPMFRDAIWGMTYETVPSGTRIRCDVTFTLRPRYWLLIIPLLLTQRRALRRDLTFLKVAIEAHDQA